MHILILNWRDIKHEWAGGGEIYIHEIAKRFVKMGNEVTLFCGQDIKNKLPPEEVVDGVRIVRKGGRFGVYFWAFIYYLRRFRKTCDVVVDVQNGIPFFTVLYSLKPKIAVVYHIHGKQFFIELPFPHNIIGYIIERYIFPFLYRNIEIQAISQTTKEDLMGIGVKSEHINIVYCGINGKNGCISKSNKKFVNPTILYLGRIKKYKRVDLLVDIMPEIVKQVPNARLLIAGWGTEASNITDSSMRCSLRKKIRIIGPVSSEEKKILLQKSWVFVNPSINEGWGISVIEANNYGTPVVAFRVQGLSESIQDKVTGLLSDNMDDFINNLVKVLTDAKLRDNLGENAFAWSKKFSWDTAAIQSLDLIKKKYDHD